MFAASVRIGERCGMSSVIARSVRRMMNVIIFAAVAYGLLLAGLYLGQRWLLYVPDRYTPDPARYGVAEAVAPVGYSTEDGLALAGWYRPAAGAGRATVVYFHGNAGHHGDRAPVVRYLWEQGYGVLLAGYRGYGGNPGRPSETGLAADARAAVGWLAEQGVAPGCVVLYGESLGSGVAVGLASEIQVAAVLLESPFSSIADVGQAHYPIFPVRALLRDRFDSARRIADIGAPLLVMHGTADRTVPIRFGRRLFDAAAEPKQAWWVEDGGHVDLHRHGAAPVVLDFLARHVTGCPMRSGSGLES